MPHSDILISLIMAVRNERGGLEMAIQELEDIIDYRLELIFIEGGSNDGTFEELTRLAAVPRRHMMTVLKQDGVGKKDAVVKGLRNARGDLSFVFDNDGEIGASELPAFINVLRSDQKVFVNGNRFRLPMVKYMHLLNRIGVKTFAVLMSVATGTRLSDPLCGIKGAWTEKYHAMIENGVFNNQLDKFAEFDQLFGASRLGLHITELPVVYRNRRYGETKVRRFAVGWQLLKRIGYEFLYRFGFVKM